jgi:hypothetical protein
MQSIETSPVEERMSTHLESKEKKCKRWRKLLLFGLEIKVKIF